MKEEEIQNEAAQTQSQREGRMFSFLLPVLEVIKVVMASVASVVFIGFSGVTLACSAVALAVSTPLFIIFSPILVPATIATTLLATGLGAGTTMGVTGMGLLMRLIKHHGGASPTGSSPAAQPSFLSLLEMPNFIKSRMRLLDIPGLGKKSEEGEEGDSEGKKGKSKGKKGKDKKKGKGSKGKDKDKKKSKGSKGKNKDKEKGKDKEEKGKEGSSDDESS